MDSATNATTVQQPLCAMVHNVPVMDSAPQAPATKECAQLVITEPVVNGVTYNHVLLMVTVTQALVTMVFAQCVMMLFLDNSVMTNHAHLI